MGEPVPLELSADEALVLFEFLSRYSDSDVLATVHQSEQRALWRLLGLLEKRLVEPFRPDYTQLLQQARDRLQGSSE
jgi:hypothetical protein